jgi:type I restriction enzyme S subunit
MDSSQIAELTATLQPIYGLIDGLRKKSATLLRLRDLLLPKLLSGEVDVSRLPLPLEAP